MASFLCDTKRRDCLRISLEDENTSALWLRSLLTRACGAVRFSGSSGNVNFLARSVFIARSKTGRTRTIPMNDIVFKELMMLKQDAGPKDFVFSNARTGVNIDSIKTGWRNACEKAGLVNLRFHDTRHTFATRLRANGVHEWDIRDLLGHASVRMTSVYTHQTPANLCHAVNTLGTKKPGKVVRFERKAG